MPGKSRAAAVPATDERGVALPLALFGLVAVSILVTSALVTSSMELALSRAHQAGAQSLFEADASLEQFVAQRAAMVSNTHQRFATGAFVVDPGAGTAYRLNVAELFRAAPITLEDGSIERREKYSLVAEPEGTYGRAVAAMIEVLRTAVPVSFNVDSGLTLGTNTTISGNATISDGSSPGVECDSATADAAIRHAAGTTLTRQGAAHDVFGEIVLDDRDAGELMDYVLGGHTIEELAEMAEIKFGPAFDKPAFSGSPSQTNNNASYRWGCPAQMVSGCTAQQAAYFPTVAIDANGGSISLTGTHGQGIIVVLNGDLEIAGNFKFGGIIISEGTLRVTGTPRLEGAVVAMGDEAVIDPGDATMTSGNSLIRFNKCQIVNAVQSLTLQSLETSPQIIDTPTYAWFEVVR